MTFGEAERSRDPSSMAYVLASYDYLFHQTPGAKEECPNGFALNNEEQWERQFPTEAERAAHLQRCLLQENRGPNCESVWENPDVIKDPVAYSTVEGEVSFGADLDGTIEGEATETTCEHEPFVSPDGEPGIDNQYYRFLGCERFIQSGIYTDQKAKERTAEYQFNRIIIRLEGVDDVVNDHEVDVELLRGKDRLLTDAEGNALAWQTQRIDETIPPVQLRGAIAGGVLTTEPADVFFSGLFHERRQLVRGMTLRLKLEGVRATGVRLGYIDIRRFWHSYARTVRWGGNTFGASAPSAYAALLELADGYKDPDTGQCTALSSARGYEFVRVHVVHPSQRDHEEA